MSSTEEIRTQLRADFPSDRVKEDLKRGGKTVAYVDAWYVIQRANEIFGEDGWSHEIISIKPISSEIVDKGSDDNGKSRRGAIVVVQCVIRVHALGTHHDGVGIGVGEMPAYNMHLATELAWKACETDGIKRALKNFGNALGLALYDKSKSSIGDSLAAQEMFRQIEALSVATKDDVIALQNWHEENADAIADLSTDESRRVTDAIRAKRSTGIKRFVIAQMDAAKSVADLNKAYRVAEDAKIDRSAMEDIIEHAKSRKTELSAQEAA